MPATSAPRVAVCLLVVLAAACLAFGAVVPGEFVVDDKLWAAQATPPANGAAQVLQTLGGWVFRPLHGLFLSGAIAIVGRSAAGLHGVSILLHGLNGILLFVLLGRLLPRLPLPFRLAVTLLFVVHPAGSEAVLWISAMSELTVTLAMLATLLLYLRWRESWTVLRILILGALFFAAYLFKETAIMLPFVLVAYELAQPAEERRLPPALFGIAAAAPFLFLLFRYAMLGSLAGGLELSVNPLRGLELVADHLRFLWLPAAAPFALRPPEIALASPVTVTVALLLFALAAAVCLRAGASRGAVWLGTVWLLLGLWPAFAVALVGDGFFNGRQAYVASIGLSLLLAALLDRVPNRHRWPVGAAFTVLLPWMAYSTLGNALAWRSNLEVYRQAAMVSPSADGPRAGMAEALAARGDNTAALAMYREALQRASTRRDKGQYLYLMASILGQSGQGAESDRLLWELVELEPANSSAWTGLGNNAWVGGHVDDAAEYYRRAVELDPANAEAVNNLAGLLSASGPAYATEAARWRLRAQAMARGRAQPHPGR